MMKHIPLFAYLLVIFNIMAFTSGGDQSFLEDPFVNIPLISGALLGLSINNVLVVLGVLILYVEIIKSTRTSSASVVDHMLSMFVFVVFLIEFLVVKQLGTASFLIAAIMALVDVVAGFTVTITSARRDLAVEQMPGI